MRMNNNNILSVNDIIKLRKAYKNCDISTKDIIFDVKSLMINEKITKEEAIKRILNIIHRYHHK